MKAKRYRRAGAGAVLVVAGLAAAIGVISRSERIMGTSAGLTAADPPPAYSGSDLDALLGPVAAEVDAGAFPGAAMAVGVRDTEVHLLSVGHIGWTRNAAAVDPRTTLYDLASLTKVIATASAVILLVEEGRLSLDEPVSRFLPEFATGPKASVTIRHMLTHTSGLPEGATLLGDNRADRIARARSFPIYPPAGARVEYSDVGYILLWEAAEAAAGEPLTEYLERKLFRPLGMTSTRFSPGLDCEACAPTGRLRDQSLYRGRPFDPLGQRLDGVGGSSGLFSNAHDLARFAAMIANDGELDGVRVMSAQSVQEFIGPQPIGGRYRLGWEVVCGDPENGGDGPCVSPMAVGHTGWTGTAIYVEPATGVWLVLLTNRTYEPRAENRLPQLRREVLSGAIELATQRPPAE